MPKIMPAPCKANLNTHHAENLLNELTEVWELAVRSSHHFLTETDILFYKPRVRNLYLPAVDIYYYLNEQGHIAAFMGLSADMIEMLFVHPAEQGKGYGRRLMEFAVHHLHFYRVDVNEQNETAFAFYRRRGFEVTGRDKTDPDGRPFPILHLALPEFACEKEGEAVISQIVLHKKRFLNLLLLADEQESMIDRYLERGDMYVLRAANTPQAVCVVTDEGNGIVELKNLAVAPPLQRQGIGRKMVRFLCARYAPRFRVMTVGTGDSPLTLPFYLSLGFRPTHRIKDFFTTHYNHPIYEGGKLLTDMVYLQKKL